MMRRGNHIGRHWPALLAVAALAAASCVLTVFLLPRRVESYLVDPGRGLAVNTVWTLGKPPYRHEQPLFGSQNVVDNAELPAHWVLCERTFYLKNGKPWRQHYYDPRDIHQLSLALMQLRRMRPRGAAAQPSSADAQETRRYDMSVRATLRLLKASRDPKEAVRYVVGLQQGTSR